MANNRYEERPVGVFDRELGVAVTPLDEGWRDYVLSGAVPDPMPAVAEVVTLGEAIAQKVVLIEERAAVARRAITGAVSPQEMSSWALKLEQARALQAGGDAPMLAMEAQARGVTAAAIASRVLANAGAYSAAEAVIAGACGRHKDAVRALEVVADVLAYDFTDGWPGVERTNNPPPP